MTKRRAPLSEHQAVRTVIERIGLAEAARQAGRRPGTVGDWSDPDRPGGLPLAAALSLDKAYLAAGGAAPPIACAYLAELHLANADAYQTARSRAEIAARAALEAGGANAAYLQAYAGGGGASALLEAERETEQAIAAYAAALHDIRRQLAGHGVERAW